MSNKTDVQRVFDCTVSVVIHPEYTIKPFSKDIPYDITFNYKDVQYIDSSQFIREILGIEDIYTNKCFEEMKSQDTKPIRINQDKFNISGKLAILGFALDSIALVLVLVGVLPFLLIPGIICNVLSLKRNW